MAGSREAADCSIPRDWLVPSRRAPGFATAGGVPREGGIFIFAVSLVLCGLQLVSDTLRVTHTEAFADCLDALSLKRQSPNVLVVVVAARSRLLKNGWVRGLPPQSILLDQTPQLSAGDQVTPNVVQPEGLPRRSQPIQRVAAHDSAPQLSSFATLATRRR